MSPIPPITEAQSQAALRWLSRISEQPAVAEGASFKRWLLAEPGHRAAYEQAQALWRNSGVAASRLPGAPGARAWRQSGWRPAWCWPLG